MREAMKRPHTSAKGSAGSYLSGVLQALFVILVLISGVYSAYYAATTGEEVAFSGAGIIVIFAVPLVLGTLINRKHPGHMIARLFLIMAYSAGLLIISYAALGLRQSGTVADSPLLDSFIYVVSTTMYIPPIVVPLLIMPLYFPSGRLLSKRWRIAVAINVIVTAQLAVEDLFLPGTISATRSAGNPVIPGWNGIPGFEPFFEVGTVIVGVLSLSIIPLLCLSVFLRYRRSNSIERTQMKWPIFTAVLCFILLLASILVPSIARFNSETGGSFIYALALMFPLSIGIAMLRYRLFDIDVIIRRTVQYGIVTALLALVYFGLVVLFQALVSDAGGEQSGIFIVISTLVIAALFNPLRLRVQAAVDRRFYRRKYQAEQALAQFASAARDEVELDRLLAALMDVVEETMQPEQASLMLVGQPEDEVSTQGSGFKYAAGTD